MNCGKHEGKPKRGAKRRKLTVRDLNKQLEKAQDAQRYRLRNHVLDALDESFDQIDDIEEARTWLTELRSDIDLKLAALDEQIQYAKEHG